MSEYIAPHDKIEKTVDKLFRKYEKKMGQAFLLAADATMESEQFKALLTQAREYGEVPDYMTNALVFDMKALEAVYRDTATASSEAFMSLLGKNQINKATFNPLAADFLKKLLHQGKLVSAQLDDKTRNAVRAAMKKAMKSDLSPSELALLLKDVIGLDDRYATAVESFRQGLINRGTSRGEARKQASAYAKRLRLARAKTIARTETSRAVHLGQRYAYDKNMTDLGIPFERASLEWITATDERTCESCSPMNGEMSPYTEPKFTTPIGDSGGPPLHPNCRCTITVRFPIGEVNKVDIEKSKPLKDPKGGLTAAGRKASGGNLKPGVKNYEKASLADKKRWISWALRFYGQDNYPPLKDKNGLPTRFALTAAAWGEPVPKTEDAARAIAAKARSRRDKLEV